MASDNEAELANAEGNRLYREGNVERAAVAYTSAIQLSLQAKVKAGDGGSADGDGGLKARSKYYANRRVVWLKLLRPTGDTGTTLNYVYEF